MDSVVQSALEEICCEAADGLHLRNLWPKLIAPFHSAGFSISPSVKRALWENLVEIPGLKFEAYDGTLLCNSAEDGIKCTVEECEERNVKILAPEGMWKSFLGIYEMEALESTLSDTQRLILQKLTVARTNGIAQSELAKELRMAPNNLFYPLKRLETIGLIVRVPTIIRKKQTSKGKEPKSDSTVQTNMLYLYRYGKHLDFQQRLEICKEDKLSMDTEVGDGHSQFGNDFTEEIEKDDVQVKDFLPAIKDICDKLGKADGKVLVVTDLKRDLGYRGASGHRAWRHICHRLKDAQVIEDCYTMVNKKTVKCLRLLKSFSPSHFEPKVYGQRHDTNLDQSVSSAKRGQTTEQLVELPILRQVYDMIDAAGSKGLTNTEVCRGLGLCNKEYHSRYYNRRIFRFGLHLKREIHNRCEVYRLFTASKFNTETSNMIPTERKTVPQEVGEPNSHVLDLNFHENLSQPMPTQLEDTSASMENVISINECENHALISSEDSKSKNVDNEGKSTMCLQSKPQGSDAELSNSVPDEEQLLVNKSVISKDQLEKSPPVVPTPSRSRSYLKYPCLTVVETSSQREQQILKMLEEEKFLVKPELHRRLENLENLQKEKNTMMDRKTLDRCLKKLQDEQRCICIDVSIPVVTNCGRSRSTLVVLHPSVSKTDELMAQIYQKMRDFEIQVRRQSYNHTRQTKGHSVTILDNVQRIQNSLRLDVQSERAEVMRANGFVPAKMVRTKLLHNYLWGWVSGSPGRDEASLSSNHAFELKNPHRHCKLFELDLAIKSMPFELFLQVVGSVQKFEDMVEKCSSGLRLSDMQESLMDTRASGRLSWLIDILLRLKLIRLVSKGNGEDRASSSNTTLTHALELKPYIEEPVSMVASCSFLSPDLRPNRRYDFILKTRKSVEDYWDTLEYCYATAKPKAALHAFPGSAVHEVFHSHAWTSVHVMTAGQRSELLQRVGKDDANRKLSFRECEKIAKDLNLTLEQVLRVYNHTRQKRTRHQRNAKGEKIQPINGKHILSLRKRKRGLAGVSSKLEEAPAEQQSSVEMLQECYTGDQIDLSQKPASNEEDKEASTLIRRSLSRLNPPRQKRFSWTEEGDRKLVIAYTSHRAETGAKFNRVSWASIANLPAHPHACRRRMSSMKSCETTRKEIMKLCEKLACRYRKYLRTQDTVTNCVVGSKKIVQDMPLDGDNTSSIPESWKWDDFDDNDIKAALDDVLRYKKMAKLEVVNNLSDQENEDFEDCGGSKASTSKSSLRKHPREHVKLLNGGARAAKQMHESVAIANAAELFKLIFLSSSTAPEVPTVLAKTLQRYSEHDLYSAFNYLREKKIMIGGSCNNPFELSQQFLQNISPPEFPKGTGRRAEMFASWIHEREINLMEEGVELPSDMQFGETFTLCALLSSGELLMTPNLPEEGVGEAEDNRICKRRYDGSEPNGGGIYKKLTTSFAGESEITSRRPKGFPGMKIYLHRETLSRLLAVESFVDEDIGVKNQRNTSSGLNVDCYLSNSDVAEHVREILDSGGTPYPVLNISESSWEAMTSYAKHLVSSCSYEVKSSSLHPNIMKTLYSAIHKSGDRGLSMKEISKVLNIEDENLLEIMVEVLVTFGQALKVNAFNSIHVVDSLYRSKYCLTSVPDHAGTSPKDRNTKSGDEGVNLDNHIEKDASSEYQSDSVADEMHRVTILNFSEDIADPPDVLSEDTISGYKHSEVAHSNMNNEVENFKLYSVGTQTCKPLLPWMNGDGTINKPVYNKLISCVLRIVMQNPGILEDCVVEKMQCLNPQSCRRLLEIMIMDNLIKTRKMQQMTSNQPPSILGNLLGNNFKKQKLICKVHLYANPKSTSFL